MDVTNMSNVVAIKRFFELNGGKKVNIIEIQQLTSADKQELGELARVELAKV
jgi:hypothetical protein